MAIGTLLTTEEVAKRLGVSVGRVRQFVSEGRLQYAQKIGPALLFDRDLVEAFAKTPRPTGRPKQTA